MGESGEHRPPTRCTTPFAPVFRWSRNEIGEGLN
jgi:hypothetical protein